MFFLYPSADIAKVASELTASWLFLSGQTRTFEWLKETPSELLNKAEFTFFMPFTVQGSNRKGGVGILISREDAVTVAQYMFGTAKEEITHSDLLDACGEVCNVCSESIASHFRPTHIVTVGLPQIATVAQYQNAAQNSVARAIYRGNAGEHALFAVLYDSPASVSAPNQP